MLCLIAGGAAADDDVTVQLVGGRSFTARIDARTDERHLWLRFISEATTILRPIEWTAVQSARQQERPLDPAQLRELAIVARTADSDRLVRPASADDPTATPRGGLHPWPVVAGADLRPIEPAPPIASLDLDAYIANWDFDVDIDGILVTVAAIDVFGNSVPIDGTLEVELVGERRPPLTLGNAFPTLGRWTRALTAADPQAAGGYYRLKLDFQAIHPDYQLWVNPYAIVHARLLVPGQGTFEASRDAVTLRNFSPVRDRIEAAFGTRYLPNERTERGHPLSSQLAP